MNQFTTLQTMSHQYGKCLVQNHHDSSRTLWRVRHWALSPASFLMSFPSEHHVCTVLTGGTEGSRTEPCLFPHKFSTRAPCGTVLTGGTEGSRTEPRLFPHEFSIWAPCGTVRTGGTDGSRTEPCLFPHEVSIWAPSGTVLTGGTEGSRIEPRLTSFPSEHQVVPCWLVEQRVPTLSPASFLTFSIWAPCGTVLTGGTEGSRTEPRLTPQMLLDRHGLLLWLVECTMIWIWSSN